jgi:DNA-binding transcriptional LysR family regulator
MNYTLHQLQVLLKIRETGSVTKASEELYLSQPAVSIQLRKLQEQFEIPIFEIVGRKISITEFGHEIADTAERIMTEIEGINYKSKIYSGEVAGKLKMAIVSTAKYIFPYFVTDFTKLHPGVDLIIDVTNKSTVIKSLEDNETDLAMVSTIPPKLKVNSVPLMKNQLYLVAGKQYGQFTKPISNKDFMKMPLIYREHGSATRLAMENYLSKRKISTSKKMELSSNEAVKQAVIAGLGVSIMPLIGIQESLESQELQIIPAKGLPLETNWNIIWLKSKNLSQVSKSFIEYVEQHKNHIIKKHFNYLGTKES